VFAWRRWRVTAGEDAQRAVAQGRQGECRSEACAASLGRSIGATHVLFSRLTRLKDGTCTAVLVLQNLLQADKGALIREDVKPCSADNVLSIAIDLGHRIAEGPRAPVRATVSLTPLELRPLDIPDIADVTELSTSSVSHRPRKISLDRALEIYKAKHMFIFDDPHPDRPSAFYIALDNKLVNDCDARRHASAPLTRDMLEYCDGNSWEYAWIGFPVGVLIAGLGANDLEQGGGFTFVFGAAVAAASAVIALVFNVDAVDVEDGTHYSNREELERIVLESNAELREVLDLTPAQVQVAGMRL
jgi:hypothetical protein